MAETFTLGLMGPPGAGKSRLAATLLDGWSRAGRLGKPPGSVRDFLARASQPTAVDAAVSVTVDRGRGRPPWNLTLLDGPGAGLADAVEAIPDGGREAKPALALIDRCDVLLFVVDPSSPADPDERSAALELAYQTAAGLVRPLLFRRGNRYLPVLFVLTHHDRWGADPAARAAAEAWAGRVTRTVKGLYRDALAGHHPPELTDPDLTAAAVNATAFEPADALLERAVRLVRAARSFDPVPWPVRVVVRSALTVALLAFLALAVWLASRVPPAAAARSLPELLAAAPGPALHDPAGARAVNEFLRQGADPAAHRDLRAKAEAVVKEPTPDRVATLGVYLAGLPAADGDLGAAQAAYWVAARARAVAQAASAAATPAALAAAAVGLRNLAFAEKTSAVEAVPADARARLVADLDAAADFFDAAAKAGGLAGRLKLTGGSAAGRAPGDRRVSYRSGDKVSAAVRLRAKDAGEGVSLEPAGGPVDVVVTPGEPGVLVLERRNAGNTGWEKEEELPLPPGPSPWAGPGAFAVKRGGVELAGEFVDTPGVPALLQGGAG